MQLALDQLLHVYHSLWSPCVVLSVSLISYSFHSLFNIVCGSCFFLQIMYMNIILFSLFLKLFFFFFTDTVICSYEVGVSALRTGLQSVYVAQNCVQYKKRSPTCFHHDYGNTNVDFVLFVREYLFKCSFCFHSCFHSFPEYIVSLLLQTSIFYTPL